LIDFSEPSSEERDSPNGEQNFESIPFAYLRVPLREAFSQISIAMLVLVDTSIWINQLRRADAQLVALLQEARVLMHPAVLGELACGRISNRQTLLALWLALPRVATVSLEEAFGFGGKPNALGSWISAIWGREGSSTEDRKDPKEPSPLTGLLLLTAFSFDTVNQREQPWIRGEKGDRSISRSSATFTSPLDISVNTDI
jgi:hypothetical protein